MADDSVTSSVSVDERLRRSRTGTFAIAVILMAIGLSWWPVLRCGFVHRDDDFNIYKNTLMKPPTIGGIVRYWKWPAWGLYAPVPYTVWSGLATLTPEPTPPGRDYTLNPMPFHAANLLLHAIASCVVWMVLKRLCGNTAAACTGALLFALHPVQVEAVAWASGLKDVLAGCFALIATWQYLIAADESVDPSDRKFHYVTCVLAACVALLSKASAAMLPGILLAIDWFLLRRSARQIARSLVPIVLLCLPVLIAARFIQNPPSIIPIWQRPILAMFTITFYVTKLVWPFSLTIDYALPPQAALQVHWIWASWIVPLCIAIGTWLTRRRRPELIAGALCAFISILPVLGFTSFEYQITSQVADHYLYFALVGVSLALAGTIARLSAVPIRAASLGTAGLVLIGLGLLTYNQIQHWRNSITLYTQNAQVLPRYWRPRNLIGLALLDEKIWKDAEFHLRASLELKESHLANSNLAVARFAQGDLQEAIARMERAIQLDGTIPLYHAQLAELYLKADRPADAEASARRALNLLPEDPQAKRALADALKRQGKR